MGPCRKPYQIAFRKDHSLCQYQVPLILLQCQASCSNVLSFAKKNISETRLFWHTGAGTCTQAGGRRYTDLGVLGDRFACIWIYASGQAPAKMLYVPAGQMVQVAAEAAQVAAEVAPRARAHVHTHANANTHTHTLTGLADTNHAHKHTLIIMLQYVIFDYIHMLIYYLFEIPNDCRLASSILHTA